MKKIIVSCLLAVGLMAVSQNQASAWVNSKFGIGLNWDYSAGGNSLLWGLWRDGQIPAPDGGMGFGGAPNGAPRYGMPPQGYGAQGAIPAPQGFAPQGYQPQGYVPQAYYPQNNGPMPQGGFDPSFAQQPYAGSPMNFGSPYQFANYPRPIYYPGTYYYGR